MTLLHRLYVGTIGEGLFRSTDGGERFVRACDGMFVECHVRALAVHPRDPRVLYLGSEQGLFRSTDGADGGETWQPLGIARALPWPYCRGLAQQCGRPEVVLLGNGDGPPGTAGVVARSADGGATWQETRMPGRANSTLWNFA